MNRDSLGFGPGYPFCVLAMKPAAYGAGGVDGTVAPLPSAAELIGLVVSEIRRIARETFPSGAEVSSIEVEGHESLWIVTFIAHHCPPKWLFHRKLLIIFWRRERDSNPR